MTGDERKRPLNERERRARDAVRGLPDPVADPAFEQRLRRAFIESKIEQGSLRRETEDGVELEQPVESERRVPGLRSAQRRRSAREAREQTRPSHLAPRRLAWSAAAAILVSLILWFVRVRNEGEWVSVLDVPVAVAGLQLDGTPVSDLRSAARTLRPGSRVTTDDSTEWVLRTGDGLLAVITPGSEVLWSNAPGRWWSRDLAFVLIRGEVRFCTGPEFAGSSLVVRTDEAVVEVAGTTLAVIRNDIGTCLCVYEGKVSLAPHDRPPEEIQAGHRRVVPKRGDLQDAELEPGERMKLQMLDDRGRALLEETNG